MSIRIRRSELTPDMVKNLLSYCPTTGIIRWKVGRKAGAQAGTEKSGYLRIAIMGVNVFAHRAAWAIAHGKWPDDVIDHINRDRKDNRLGNLRDVSGLENARNKSRRGRKK